MPIPWAAMLKSEDPSSEKSLPKTEAYLHVTVNKKLEVEAMHLLEDEHKQKMALELLEQYMRFKQEAEKENKKSKKEKDPLKPKHPTSAFFMFTNDRRPALVAKNKNVTEITKIIGKEWKNMTNEQKLPYEEMTRKNKEKYMQEMEAYKEMKEEEASNLKKEDEELMKLQKHEALQLLKKKKKTKNIIKETRNALLEERPGTNSTTITAMISLKWKEMKEEEKMVRNEKAAEAIEAYKKKVLEHNRSVVAASSSAN